MDDMKNLYEQMLVEQDTEKVAGDVNSGSDMDAGFFEKVAAGDEQAVAEVGEFIDQAIAAGHSEEDIETALGEAMIESGYDTGDDGFDGDFDQAKEASYAEGFEEGVIDALNSDMAKAAGVTFEDLVEFELGQYKGAGYVDSRQTSDEVIAKIAGIRETAAAGYQGAKDKGRALLEILKGARVKELKKPYGIEGVFGKNRKKDLLNERLKTWGARAGAAGAAGGAGYGAYRGGKAMFGKKDK